MSSLCGLHETPRPHLTQDKAPGPAKKSCSEAAFLSLGGIQHVGTGHRDQNAAVSKVRWRARMSLSSKHYLGACSLTLKVPHLCREQTRCRRRGAVGREGEAIWVAPELRFLSCLHPTFSGVAHLSAVRCGPLVSGRIIHFDILRTKQVVSPGLQNTHLDLL